MRRSQYPADSVLQSMLVSDTHPDVVAHGRAGAIAVARRHELRVLTPEHKGTHCRFRQVSPALVDPASYATVVLGHGETKLVFARLLPSVNTASLRRTGRRASGHPRHPALLLYRRGGLTVAVKMTRDEAKGAPEHAHVASLVDRYTRAHVTVTSTKNARPPRKGTVVVRVQSPGLADGMHLFRGLRCPECGGTCGAAV